MAFFDIGINVTINNIPAVISQINQLNASMRSLPAAAQSSTSALNGTSVAMQQTSNSSQQVALALKNSGNALNQFTLNMNNARVPATSLGLSMSNMLQPINSASIGVQQLGLTTQNTLRQIQSGGNALNQFNGQLGQTSSAFTNTERSGNRLAEIFRGNRGLVFGFSALFGTLTGIAFELQLVNDANQQVSESQARVNELVARGQEGTGQYSQALQALGKDQRFLEFSSRNLALAFTNLIPDLLLIINGVLSLRDKLAPAGTAMQVVAGSAVTAGTSFRTMGVSAATSVAPLAAMGVAGRGAAGGMNAATVAATGLRAALLTIGLPVAVFAALVVGTTLVLNEIRKLSIEAQGLDPVYRRLMGVQEQVKDSTLGMSDAFETSKDNIGKTVGALSQEVHDHYQKMIADTLTFAKKVEEASQVKVLGPPSAPAETPGLRGGTPTVGGTKLTQKDIDTISKETFTSGGIMQNYPPAPPPTDIEKQLNIAQQIDAQMTSLIAKARQPGELFSLFPKQLDLTVEDLIKANDLLAQFNEAVNPPEGKQADPLKAAQLKQDLIDLITGKEALKNADEEAKKKEEELRKAYEDSQRVMNDYNTSLEKMPLILQDTGFATKKVSDNERERIALIRNGASVFVGYADAQRLSLGVAEQVFQQGKALTDGLIKQRDSIAATNILWASMDTIVLGTTQTMGEWILAQQEAIGSSIDMTRAVTNQTYQQYLVNAGYIQGKLAVQGWVDSLYQAVAAEETEQQFLEAIVGTYMKLSPAIIFTTQDLKALGEEMARTGDNAKTMDEIMNKAFASSRGALSDLVKAAAEGGKQWKDAWKDLDKSFIPKGERGEVKDFINDLGDIQKAAASVAAPLGIFMGLMDAGRISGKENSKWTKELTEGMRGMRDALGEIAGMDVAGKIFDPLIKFKKDGLTQNEVQIWAAVANEYQRLSDMPGVWTDERTRQLDQFTSKLLEQKKAYDELVKAADKAEKSVKNVASIMVSPSGSGVTVKPDRPLTEKEYEEQVKELKKKGVFKLTPRADDPKTDKKDTDKLVEDLEKRVPAAAQKAQTAIANLSKQGANSMAILEKAVAVHVTSLNTFFGTTVPVAAQKSQTALANLGVQGGASISLLTVASVVLSKAIIIVATDVLAWVATNNVLAKTLLVVEKDVRTVIAANNILARTIVQVGKDFSSAADDAGDFANGLDDVTAAAKKATAALKALKAAGGGGSVSAQGGFHTSRLEDDTIILAHKGEAVDVGPGVEKRRTASGSGGDITINLTTVTHNELDGELIGTTVTRKTFRKMSTR